MSVKAQWVGGPYDGGESSIEDHQARIGYQPAMLDARGYVVEDQENAVEHVHIPVRRHDGKWFLMWNERIKT